MRNTLSICICLSKESSGKFLGISINIFHALLAIFTINLKRKNSGVELTQVKKNGSPLGKIDQLTSNFSYFPEETSKICRGKTSCELKKNKF